jgi:hypothetical protein
VVADKETLDLIKEWTEDPKKLFDWRTETFKGILIMLNRDYIQKLPSGRMGHANQLKAAELIMKLGSALEEIRDEVPVSCPECKHVFTV